MTLSLKAALAIAPHAVRRVQSDRECNDAVLSHHPAQSRGRSSVYYVLLISLVMIDWIFSGDGKDSSAYAYAYEMPTPGKSGMAPTDESK